MRTILSLRPARRREIILQFVETLAQNPFVKGDLTVFDSSGRENQIKILQGAAVTFWPDHAVREIRIVSVRSLSRG